MKVQLPQYMGLPTPYVRFGSLPVYIVTAVGLGALSVKVYYLLKEKSMKNQQEHLPTPSPRPTFTKTTSECAGPQEAASPQRSCNHFISDTLGWIEGLRVALRRECAKPSCPFGVPQSQSSEDPDVRFLSEQTSKLATGIRDLQDGIKEIQEYFPREAQVGATDSDVEGVDAAADVNADGAKIAGTRTTTASGSAEEKGKEKSSAGHGRNRHGGGDDDAAPSREHLETDSQSLRKSMESSSSSSSDMSSGWTDIGQTWNIPTDPLSGWAVVNEDSSDS